MNFQYYVAFHRFGMMWPGAEPQRGQYNETYFNIVKDIVKK